MMPHQPGGAQRPDPERPAAGPAPSEKNQTQAGASTQFQWRTHDSAGSRAQHYTTSARGSTSSAMQSLSASGRASGAVGKSTEEPSTLESNTVDSNVILSSVTTETQIAPGVGAAVGVDAGTVQPASWPDSEAPAPKTIKAASTASSESIASQQQQVQGMTRLQQALAHIASGGSSSSSYRTDGGGVHHNGGSPIGSWAGGRQALIPKAHLPNSVTSEHGDSMAMDVSATTLANGYQHLGLGGNSVLGEMSYPTKGAHPGMANAGQVSRNSSRSILSSTVGGYACTCAPADAVRPLHLCACTTQAKPDKRGGSEIPADASGNSKQPPQPSITYGGQPFVDPAAERQHMIRRSISAAVHSPSPSPPHDPEYTPAEEHRQDHRQQVQNRRASLDRSVSWDPSKVTPREEGPSGDGRGKNKLLSMFKSITGSKGGKKKPQSMSGNESLGPRNRESPGNRCVLAAGRLTRAWKGRGCMHTPAGLPCWKRHASSLS